MRDLISRQAAIDDIRTLKPDGLLVDAKWIEMWLKQLPSAQPEPCVNTIDALNESIKHFDDMAEECRRNANIERNDYMDMRDDAAEYRQLSIWLNELKWLRERFQLQPEQHWIPCSEKLPECNESVLTWDGYAFCIEKRIPYIRDDDGEPIEGDWWVSDEYDEYESEYYPNLRDGAAIAWMPLPEPYRGGGE